MKSELLMELVNANGPSHIDEMAKIPADQSVCVIQGRQSNMSSVISKYNLSFCGVFIVRILLSNSQMPTALRCANGKNIHSLTRKASSSI